MHLRPIDYFLWFVVPLLQLGILVLFFRRKLYRNYPYFLAYTMLQIVSVVFLAIASRASFGLYYYAYYSNLVLTDLVSFLVIWEILNPSFRWHRGAQRSGLFLLLSLSVVLIAVLGMLLTAQTLSGIGGLINSWLVGLDRVLRILQIAVLVVLTSWGGRLGVSRRSVIYGVGLGFAFVAAVNMVVFEILSHHTQLSSTTLARINAVAYVFACVIWLLYSIYGSANAGSLRRLISTWPPPDDRHDLDRFDDREMSVGTDLQARVQDVG